MLYFFTLSLFHTLSLFNIISPSLNLSLSLCLSLTLFSHSLLSDSLSFTFSLPLPFSIYLSVYLSLTLSLASVCLFGCLSSPVLLCKTSSLWISFISPSSILTQLADLKLEVLNCLQSELEEHLSKKWPLIFREKKVLFTYPSRTLGLCTHTHKHTHTHTLKKRERERENVRN